MVHINLYLFNLALVLGVAAFTSVIFQKLKQPVVLGYLLAGIIVGPHFPLPIFADTKITHDLAEVGMILLMFAIGLEFRIGKLIRLLPNAGIIAIIQCGFMMWLGYVVSLWLGWTTLEGIYMGAIIAISSTTIIAKVFEEKKIKGSLAETVYGILIFEDLIVILLLAFLPNLSLQKSLPLENIINTLGSLVFFLAALIAIGLLLIPRFIKLVVKMGRPETITIVSVGICFLMALLVKVCGYSVALGAFLAGTLIAESNEQLTIERLIRPIRDMFSAVFFVTVGMLINPNAIIQHWGAVLIFTLLVIFGKIIGVSIGAFLTGHNIRTSFKTGMSLAQIGEFSFVIAGVGISSGATGDFVYSLAIAVATITTLSTPWLIQSSDLVSQYVDQKLPKSLQTFASLYTSWISRLREHKFDSEPKPVVRRFVLLIFFDILCIIFILWGASFWFENIRQLLSSLFYIPLEWTRLVIFSITLFIVLPFLIGIIRCARSLGYALAQRFIPHRQDGQGLDLAATPRKTFILTLQVVLLAAIGFILFLFFQALLPNSFAIALFVTYFVVLGILFFKNTESLQGHVSAGAQMIVEILSSPQLSDATEFSQKVEKILPGLGNVTSLNLEKNAKSLGKSLAELNLRGLTGVAVIAIKRGEQNLMLPSATEKLKAHDILVLTGSQDAIQAAKELLS